MILKGNCSWVTSSHFGQGHTYTTLVKYEFSFGEGQFSSFELLPHKSRAAGSAPFLHLN